MKIHVNGEPMEVSCTTLADLLTELDYTVGIVATAVDGVFVAKAQRQETWLKEGMGIEIVAPMQGG